MKEKELDCPEPGRKQKRIRSAKRRGSSSTISSTSNSVEKQSGQNNSKTKSVVIDLTNINSDLNGDDENAKDENDSENLDKEQNDDNVNDSGIGGNDEDSDGIVTSIEAESISAIDGNLSTDSNLEHFEESETNEVDLDANPPLDLPRTSSPCKPLEAITEEPLSEEIINDLADDKLYDESTVHVTINDSPTERRPETSNSVQESARPESKEKQAKGLSKGVKNSDTLCSPRKKSAKSRKRPKSSIVRPSSTKINLDIVRPYSAMPMGRRSSDRTSRPSTAVPFRITKEDLDYYLPRKSNFSCHDKTLKDAGYEVEVVSGAQKRKKELLAILQQTRDNRKLKNSPMFGHRTPTEIQMVADANLDNSDLKENSDEHLDGSTVQTLQIQKSSQRKVRSGKKKSEYDEEEVRVDDYQPLLHYLKYIQDNPDEFISHRQQLATSNLVEVRPNDRMVRMGSIFQRGQHGVSSDSIVVKAVHEIRQRFCDPSQWTSTSKDKTLFSLTSAKKEPSFPQTKTSENTEANANIEEPKSEYEIRKKKMEAWLKTISTAQLNKAKELALHDLGEEDRSNTKWWQYMKSCHYIR